MMSPVFRLPLFLMLCLALAAGGCTKQARMERRLAGGNKAAEAGDFKLAEAEYRAALGFAPEEPKIMGRIGILIYNQGRPLSAYYVLDGVRNSLPDDLDIQLYYGLSCLSLMRTAEARIAAKKVLEARPDSEDALLLLVGTCVTTRDNAEAQHLVEKYRDLSKNPGAHHVALGALLLARNELPAAEAEFRKALEINPKLSSAYAYLGILAQGQDKMEQAGLALKQAAELSPLRAPRRINYIDFLMKRGAYAEAQKELAKILDVAPDYVPAWGLKMKIAFLQEKYEESEEAAAEVLSRDHANYDAMMQRAAIKLVKRDFEGVIAQLKTVEGIFDRAPQVKYQLALAYLKNGNSGRAEDYLQQALLLSPNYDDAILMLAELNIQKGNPGTATPTLTRLIERRPDLARAYLLLAQAHRAQGNRGKALEILRMLAVGYAEVADGPYLVGTILVELDRKKEAREAFEQSLSRSGNYWPAVEGLVDLDLAEQQTPAAADRVKLLMEKNPNVVPLWLLRAKIRLLTGDATGAESDLLKAIELEPKAQYPYLLLARIYYSSDRAKEALEKLTALAVKKPAVNVFMQLGMLQDALKHYDEARANYEKALALDSTFSPALNNLAVLYGDRLGQVDKAYEFATQAQAQRPYDVVIGETFGWALFRKGQYERGLRFAQQAADKIPADPEIQYHLGMIQYFLGQVEPARQSFQKVLASVGPSVSKEDAARRLAVLALDPTNPDPAIRTQLERVAHDDPNDPNVLSRLAQVELRAGQAREAAGHYEAVLKINAGAVPAMMALIELDFGPLAKPERARELAKLVRSAAPNDQQIAGQLGHMLVGAGDFASASTMLADAVRAFPGQPEIHFDLARSYYGLGRVTEAEKSLATALGIEGAFPVRKPAARMAALIAAAGQPVLQESDLQAAREALAEDATNVPALMVGALDLERHKNYKEAVGAYEKILKIYPLFAPAMRQLAILYSEQLGDDEKAEQFAQKARLTLTEDAELEFQLGTINYRRGDYAGAVRFLQQSLRRRADRADSLFFLGMAHFQLKNTTEAKVELQRAVELKMSPQEETEAKRVLDLINRGGG